ncbi:MAG: hypothetical protein AAFQ59_08475, partial [Pseudomonadota bacterium]
MRILSGLLWLLLATVLATSAPAQSLMPGTDSTTEEAVPTLPDPLTEEAANALISRLSDGEVRALLLDQLNAQAQADTAADAGEIEDFLYHATTGAFSAITVAIERLPLLFSEQMRAFSRFGNFVGVNGLMSLAGYFALVLIGAFAIEFAFRRLIRSWLVLPPRTGLSTSLRDAVVPLGKRLTSEIVSVAIFIIAAAQITRYA